jgi:hypothetical protein
MSPRALGPAVLLCACIDLDLDADLEGPRLVGGDLPGPRTVEVPVAGPLVLRFSEPIDPAQLHVALVAWPTAGSCMLTPVCDEGSCERGRCQTDPLTDADLRAALRGDPLDDALPLSHVLSDSSFGPATELRVTPLRPLAAHARHSLLVSARDRRGAPLVDEHGVAALLRRDLVTAARGSSGPEPLLVSPPADAGNVPTDLARVETAFPRPIARDAAATLDLLGDDGSTLALVDPQPCPGWLPDLCLSWRTAAPLSPGVAYQLGAGTLRDGSGRLAVPPPEPALFRAGAGPDPAPPDLSQLALEERGRCVHAVLTAAEPLRLRISTGAAARELVAPAGPVDLGLALAGPPGAAVPVLVEAWDLAGRRAERTFEHVLGDTFDPSAPPLALTEILANPRGREPAQEFVELVDLRPTGPPLQHVGLRLVDGPAGALDLEAGDPLPPFTSVPGQRLLVVPTAYDPAEGSDPAPAPGALLVRTDASLAGGGLKNGAGEALALVWEAGPNGPVLLDSYGGWHDAGDLPGRSLARPAGGCDAPAAWRPHPSGAAAPGLAP